MKTKLRLTDVDELWKKLEFEQWYDNADRDEIALPLVADATTVDADPVVHGRWVDTGDSYEDERCRYNYWGCSACGNRIAGRYGLHNYCQNCGAKMDLGVE